MKSCLIKLILLACLIGPQAEAQESLNTILERGHVAEWLVCGPFTSDVEGGILRAVEDDRPVLRTFDYMVPVGGIARVKPRHLLQVPTHNGEAIWQRAGVVDESLDLGPFYPDLDEGVTYAAFYAQSDVAKEVYLDIQSAFGVRAYLNGFPLHEFKPAPLGVGGVDRLVAEFRAGENLLVIEVPGAHFGALAKAANSTTGNIREALTNRRELLKGVSGFEIAVRLSPVTRIGDIVFVPKLTSTGHFSGYAEDARQDTEIIVFNPTNNISPPVYATATVDTASEPIRAALSQVPPLSQKSLTLPVPLGRSEPGASLQVTVDLAVSTSKARFISSIARRNPPDPGKVYVVSIPEADRVSAAPQASRYEQRLNTLSHQLAMLEPSRNIGFQMGGIADWKPFYTLYPEHRDAIRRNVQAGKLAAFSGYGNLDERVVSGELLARNLIYGYRQSIALLGGWNSGVVSWNTPGFAPQSPQIWNAAGVGGVVHNLPTPGLPSLYYQIAPNGDRTLQRRKQEGPEARSSADLRSLTLLQRKELLQHNLRSDILINAGFASPRDAFWVEDATKLASAFPAVETGGNGARRFFEGAPLGLRNASATPRTKGRVLTESRLGELLLEPDLLSAHALTDGLTLTAEKFATLASLLGAGYPDASLDYAWRQLLYHASPSRLTDISAVARSVDTLGAYRHAASVASEVLQNSTAYIAEQVNTYDKAPAQNEGDSALLVFNSSSWTRTGLARATLNLDSAEGLTLLDAEGEAIAFQVDARTDTALSIRFVAEDIPAIGYKTFFIRPEGELPTAKADTTPSISNDSLKISFDPVRGGAISSVTDLTSGAELVGSLWNDVLAFPEDTAENGGGANLWTNGKAIAASDAKATIRVERLPALERAIIESPFLGGTLTRTLTLYRGIPRIYCTLSLKGHQNSKLLALSNTVANTSLLPVYGDRFAALTGRNADVSGVFQTTNGLAHGASGVRPFYRWAAVSEGDHLRLPDGTSVPIAPAAIIHGPDSLLRNAALLIQETLLSRGIPCDVWPDTLPEPNPIWTDSTDFESHDEDLSYGTAFRIVLGDAQHNAFTARLQSETTPEADIHFIPAANSSPTRPPTLIMQASEPDLVLRDAEKFAESIVAGGSYSIENADAFETAMPSESSAGLALLTRGAGLASAQEGNTLITFLKHPRADDSMTEVDVIDTEYWLYPFAGTWRSQGVVREAHAVNEPFITQHTDLHVASLPSERSFLSVDSSDFFVTSVAPAETALVSMSGDKVNPADGIVVRGYEASGRPSTETIRFFTPVYDASSINLLGGSQRDLSVDRDEISIRTAPFQIASMFMQPNVRSRRGQPTSLEASQAAKSAIFARHWKYNEGAAPIGSQAITLRLDGKLVENEESLRVTVANNFTDIPVSGTVEFLVPDSWTVVPASIDYDLLPSKFSQQDILLFRDGTTTNSGAVQASSSERGRLHYDILTQRPDPLQLRLERKESELYAVVKNQTAIPMRGHVDLIVPVKHWPEAGAERPVFPARQPFHVLPFREQRLVFHMPPEFSSTSATAKLSGGGQIIYVPIPETN